MSWGPCCTDAWYIGPAPHHYCSYEFYVPDTWAYQISASAQFFPTYCEIPSEMPIKKQHALLPNSSSSSNNNAMCPPILTFLASNAPLKLSRKSINSTSLTSKGGGAGSRSSEGGTYTLQQPYRPKNTQNSQTKTQLCHLQQHTWPCLHPRTNQVISTLKPSAAHRTHYGSTVATTYTNAARHTAWSTLQVSINTTSYTNWILPNNQTSSHHQNYA